MFWLSIASIFMQAVQLGIQVAEFILNHGKRPIRFAQGLVLTKLCQRPLDLAIAKCSQKNNRPPRKWLRLFFYQNACGLT